jgi:hypothetical protein
LIQRQENKNMPGTREAIHTLEQLRADFPITRSFAYFQTGSYAPVPLSTQRIMGELLRAENESFIALGGKGARRAKRWQICWGSA